MNTARDRLRTVDHLMPHISTVPADKGEQVKIFVREKVLAAELIVLVSQGNLPARTSSPDSATAVEQAHREFSINGAAAGITEIAKLDAIDGKPVVSLANRIGTGGS